MTDKYQPRFGDPMPHDTNHFVLLWQNLRDQHEVGTLSPAEESVFVLRESILNTATFLHLSLVGTSLPGVSGLMLSDIRDVYRALMPDLREKYAEVERFYPDISSLSRLYFIDRDAQTVPPSHLVGWAARVLIDYDNKIGDIPVSAEEKERWLMDPAVASRGRGLERVLSVTGFLHDLPFIQDILGKPMV